MTDSAVGSLGGFWTFEEQDERANVVIISEITIRKLVNLLNLVVLFINTPFYAGIGSRSLPLQSLGG